MARLLALLVALALAGCGERERAVEPASTPAAPPRLYLAGDGEAWIVDVAAGTARHVAPVPELPPGDPPVRLVRRGDRLVAWGYTTHVFDAEMSRPPAVLARDTWIMLPAAEDDRVWLGFLAPRQPATSVRLAALREVTVGGEVTVEDVAPPDGQWPRGAVRDGLLFERADGVHVWDPRTREDVRVLEVGQVAAVHRDRIAACAEPCRELRLVDPRTAAEVRVPAPEGAGEFHAHESAFSPDGTHLAVAVGGPERRLAIVDTAGAKVQVVEGSEVPAGYVLATWSASGEHVFLTGGERFRERAVVAYRLGDPRARRLDVAVGDFYDVTAR